MKNLDNLKPLTLLNNLDNVSHRKHTNTQPNEQFQQINNNIFQKINMDNPKPIIIKQINNIWEIFK